MYNFHYNSPLIKKIISTSTHITSKIKKNPFKIIIALSILYPFIISLSNILNASIPFWYDSARDFLLALDNLKKPTLIGPPSGIPGVFYGPYWIWLISAGLVFSKDPRFVAILVSLLPYFTIFPFILSKFSNVYGKKITILLWLLFIFSFQTYTTFLWNPHLAPLLFLLLTYMLVNAVTLDKSIKYYIKILIAGIISGLILNFHISFGLGIFLASAIFLCLMTIIKMWVNRRAFLYVFFSNVIAVILFICGFFISLAPYVVFEFRHDFLQSRALLKTLTNAILYNSASVGQTGMKPPEIVFQLFVGRTAELLSIKSEYITAIYFLIGSFILYKLIRKKISFTKNEKIIILYSSICLLVLLLLFVSSKNPVWQYHFIGVEIIVILLTGIVLKKWNLLERNISFWTIVFVISSLLSFLYPFKPNPYLISSLATKKYIVEQIYQDADRYPFSVFAYSPAIYTYDFDYIFKWLGEDVYKKLPEQDTTKVNLIYLIIPKTSEAIQFDFINWKTPDEKYVTADKWMIPDGTIVVKRALLDNNQ